LLVSGAPIDIAKLSCEHFRAFAQVAFTSAGAVRAGDFSARCTWHGHLVSAAYGTRELGQATVAMLFPRTLDTLFERLANRIDVINGRSRMVRWSRHGTITKRKTIASITGKSLWTDTGIVVIEHGHCLIPSTIAIFSGIEGAGGECENGEEFHCVFIPFTG